VTDHEWGLDLFVGMRVCARCGGRIRSTMAPHQEVPSGPLVVWKHNPYGDDLRVVLSMDPDCDACVVASVIDR